MQKIYIWGAGNKLEDVYRTLDFRKCIVKGIIDSSPNKQGTNWNGLNILNPDTIEKLDFDYILISVMNWEDIVDVCKNKGIPEKKIAVFWAKKMKYDFLNLDRYENLFLKIENRELKIKLNNIRYELGVERVPHILDSEKLLNTILNTHTSLCRFGDGEFEMIRQNERPWFQNSSKNLSLDLKRVLNNNNNRINIALADNYGNLEKYTEEAANGIREYMTIVTRDNHMKLLDMNKVYYDAYVTRPYMIYKDKGHAKKIFELWKKIFEERNILLVEGRYSRFGINSDLLDSAKSVRRIICPEKNAYEKYSEILNTVIKYVNEEDLVLITLGPTATVLAYDIAKQGYQAIDIGQLDNEYDWYKMKSEKKVPINGKCVAETNNGRIPDNEIDLNKYNTECIAKIL